VGSCVGLRGIRIQNIVNELNGERIDVIQWDPNPSRFVANALSPAQVLTVRIDEEQNTASVIVPDRQLSLAIGKEGQNARLAAKLTGWRIDIKPESAMSEELAAEVAAEQAALAQAEPAAVRRVAPPPEPKRVLEPVEQVQRAEAPEPWMEVVEAEEGAAAVAEQAEAVPAAESPAGLRFAEDLTPAIDDGTKKAKKKGKKAEEETAEAKGKKAARKGRRLATVVDEEEDIDFETGLEQFWSDEPKEEDI
jgi:N utilization substance protein A